MTYKRSMFAACLAGLSIATHFAAEVAVGLFDLLFADPMRWLFRPDHSIELELRRLDTITPESLHLERDKRMKAFMARELKHPDFYGTRGFMPDYAL